MLQRPFDKAYPLAHDVQVVEEEQFKQLSGQIGEQVILLEFVNLYPLKHAKHLDGIAPDFEIN